VDWIVFWGVVIYNTMVTKPVAPQTASVGVGTTSMVRKEGEVIRSNMAWTLIILAYLILIGLLYYFVLPGAMEL
jgi:lactate permease